MRFKVGIVQGRLLPPVDNHIQEFPINNWRDEFDLIENLGINHIEWIITKKSLENGALDLDLKSYSKKISSICCDNLIDKRIFCKHFLSEQLRPICNFAIKNQIKVISIPLLEDSKFPADNQIEFVELLSGYGKVYPDLDFYFEMESSSDIALKLVESSDNFYYTYDTGNITSCRYDHEEYLNKLMHKIRNVHLKDRVITPLKTVEPGNGDTNFKLIFDILKKNNYIYSYTIQTARGKSGSEIETIKRHVRFYEQFI